MLNDHPLVYYRLDAPSYSAPPSSLWPVLTNYGSAGVPGSYPPNTIPGGIAGPQDGGFVSNLVASPINGLDAAVDAGYSPEYNQPTGQPVSATIWIRGYPDDGRLQSPMSHGDHSWRFAIDSSGKAHWSSGNTNYDVTSVKTVNDGQWHFLAGVYTGSENLLYIDGALDSTVATSGSIAGDGYDVFLGGAPDYISPGNEAYFAGAICQAAFFTNALTATQIQQVYDTATQSTLATPTLSIRRNAGNVVLTWSVGSLQSATNVAGPYNPVTNATSPYSMAPNGTQMFYRASNP